MYCILYLQGQGDGSYICTGRPLYGDYHSNVANNQYQDDVSYTPLSLPSQSSSYAHENTHRNIGIHLCNIPTKRKLQPLSSNINKNKAKDYTVSQHSGTVTSTGMKSIVKKTNQQTLLTNGMYLCIYHRTLMSRYIFFVSSMCR